MVFFIHTYVDLGRLKLSRGSFLIIIQSCPPADIPLTLSLNKTPAVREADDICEFGACPRTPEFSHGGHVRHTVVSGMLSEGREGERGVMGQRGCLPERVGCRGPGS